MSASASYQESKVIAPQIDFLMRRTVAPRYKWLKVPLNNVSSSSVTLAPGTTTILEWKLPTRVYNLARSYIGATVKAPAGAAATYNNMFEDTFDLGNNITFGSSQGVDLVNLSFANNYVKIARRLDTKLEDYLGNDKMSGLYKSNTLASANVLPADNSGASDNFLETQYMSQGAVAADLVNYRQYPLSIFVGTLLGVDRDFYAPVEQYLRITAGTPEKTTWNTASTVPTNTPIANPAGVTYSNLYLYLCIEQNPEIILGMLKKYEDRQLIFRIPYTTAFRTVGTTAVGSMTNVSINFPQQYGKRLKRIIHVPFHPVERLNTAYDCDNTAGKKVASYQTYLDSQQIQDHALTCALPDPVAGVANNEDWLENKKYADKSVYTSKENYQRNWFHIDQFFEPRNKDSQLPEANVDEGLIMDTSKQWLFSCTVGASGAPGGQGLAHYTFAEFQREIMMTELGGVFV